MRKKTLLFIFVIFACNGGLSGSPNILLIIVDDLRPEINTWGKDYIHTPNMDRLAGKGVSFTSAYCQYANCAPSRKSILSGLSPETTFHGGGFNAYDKVMKHTTLPGYFKNKGYYTATIGKVYHDARDDRDSWDFYYDVGDPQYPGGLPWESYGLKENQDIVDQARRPAVEGEDLPMENYNDYLLCRVALDQIKEHRGRNFFLAVGFRKPHLPFAAPKKYWDLYDREDILTAPYPVAPLNGDTVVYQWSELAAYAWYAENYLAENYRDVNVPDDQSRELRHGYFACVSYIDELVGMLLNQLKELEIDDNTIVVLISDHGYHLGDQQIWGKHSCYDLSTRVPLILYDPSNGQTARTCTEFVELLDLYPTLAELCGMPRPESVDGKSLVPMLNNTGHGGSDAAFNQYQTFQKDSSIRDLMAYAIHTRDYNYIEWQDLENDRNVVQRELYRVSDVRVEQENLSTQPDLQGEIRELSRRIEDRFNPYRESYSKYLDHKAQ